MQSIFQTPQKLPKMLTTSGSRVNRIHFSGFSTLGILSNVRTARRAKNRESTILQSTCTAFFRTEWSQVNSFILWPLLGFFLKEVGNFFTVFMFNARLVGRNVPYRTAVLLGMIAVLVILKFLRKQWWKHMMRKKSTAPSLWYYTVTPNLFAFPFVGQGRGLQKGQVRVSLASQPHISFTFQGKPEKLRTAELLGNFSLFQESQR